MAAEPKQGDSAVFGARARWTRTPSNTDAVAEVTRARMSSKRMPLDPSIACNRSPPKCRRRLRRGSEILAARSADVELGVGLRDTLQFLAFRKRLRRPACALHGAADVLHVRSITPNHARDARCRPPSFSALTPECRPRPGPASKRNHPPGCFAASPSALAGGQRAQSPCWRSPRLASGRWRALRVAGAWPGRRAPHQFRRGTSTSRERWRRGETGMASSQA